MTDTAKAAAMPWAEAPRCTRHPPTSAAAGSAPPAPFPALPGRSRRPRRPCPGNGWGKGLGGISLEISWGKMVFVVDFVGGNGVLFGGKSLDFCCLDDANNNNIDSIGYILRVASKP